MKALVTNATGLLGANLIRALRWEGHKVVALVPSLTAATWFSSDSGVTPVAVQASDCISDGEVVFETTPGNATVLSESGFARFTTGELLAPGGPADSSLGVWIDQFLKTGQVSRHFGGTRITDARDLALTMIASAERRLSGHFSVAGPRVAYEDILVQLEAMSGVKAKAGGSVELAPLAPELFGEPLNIGLRPIRETLLDLLQWHSTRHETSTMVA
ncbi:MAG: hypothetical protein H7Y20_01355 [Bryobacteraceae bacterium]|nr:hypothetical protein [Bryobacteraceae bacterium]